MAIKINKAVFPMAAQKVLNECAPKDCEGIITVVDDVKVAVFSVNKNKVQISVKNPLLKYISKQIRIIRLNNLACALMYDDIALATGAGVDCEKALLEVFSLLARAILKCFNRVMNQVAAINANLKEVLKSLARGKVRIKEHDDTIYCYVGGLRASVATKTKSGRWRVARCQVTDYDPVYTMNKADAIEALKMKTDYVSGFLARRAIATKRYAF